VGAALRAFEGLGQLLSASALTHTQYRVMLFVGAREEVGAEIETIAEGVELSLGHAANVTRSLVRGRMITTSAPGAPLRLTVRGGDLLARLARRRLAGLCEAEHRLAVLGRAG
jgi:DNA-binding MarR family transcriptional regulator